VNLSQVQRDHGHDDRHDRLLHGGHRHSVYRYAEIPQYMKNSEAQAAQTGEPLEVYEANEDTRGCPGGRGNQHSQVPGALAC
jgi:hypothetical protein